MPSGFRSLAAALAIGAGAFAATAPEGLAAEEAPDLVTIVTAEDPQTQLMAMVLTMQAVEQGHSVHMLLCGPGGDIGLADAPESATAPQAPRDMSPQGLMQAIMDAGATVQVCAIYLPNAGLTEDDLLDGVTVAEPPAMAQRMMTPETRVWSF
jgi:predicted peroxiredoxin